MAALSAGLGLQRAEAEDPPMKGLERALGSLNRDESLSRAARRHLRDLARGTAHARWSAIRGALRHEGLADAQVLPFAAFSSSVPELEVWAMRYLDERIESRGFTHYGLALIEDGSRRGLAIFFARRLVELPPLPVGRPPRSLRGVLLTNATSVEGYFTLASGEVRRAEAKRQGRSVRVLAPEEGEVQALEMIVHTSRGPEVAAQVTYHPAPRPSGLRVVDLPSMRRAITELRRQQDAPALEPSKALAEAAAEHARWVCEHRLAVHLRPDGVGPVERARAVGYKGEVLENIAIASSLEEAHQNLLDSPSHRMNLLAAEAKLLGLGAAERTLPGGPMSCLVQLFGVAP